MLPAPNRLTGAAGFRSAVRGGRRAGSRSLVVHTRTGADSTRPVRIGLVVSRAVGNSVVRNRVKRRLRHLLRDRLDQLAAGDVVVVRALPAACTATSQTLGRDLDRCLTS